MEDYSGTLVINKAGYKVIIIGKKKGVTPDSNLC